MPTQGARRVAKAAPKLPRGIRFSRSSRVLRSDELLINTVSPSRRDNAPIKPDYPVYTDADKPPYESLGVIGQGSYAYVEKVRDSENNRSAQIFAARKAIDIRMDDEARVLREIHNEVKAIQSHRHKHIIQLITTYRYRNEFSIIMPLADCSLRTFLQDPEVTGLTVDPIRRLELLKRWPGCLLRAIYYIYETGYRHTDIKPDNILVYDDDVVITDFGIAKEVLELASTGSTGTPGPRTKMYRAPEALELNRRGRGE